MEFPLMYGDESKPKEKSQIFAKLWNGSHNNLMSDSSITGILVDTYDYGLWLFLESRNLLYLHLFSPIGHWIRNALLITTFSLWYLYFWSYQFNTIILIAKPNISALRRWCKRLLEIRNWVVKRMKGPKVMWRALLAQKIQLTSFVVSCEKYSIPGI